MPAAVGLRDQEQQRLGVALQLERAAVRRVRDQLDPVGDARGPLAVARAEVADEPRHHAVDARERGQERPRVALAEERPGVRDPERRPVRLVGAARVLEPGEVVEVGAVRDRLHRPVRPERAHLVGDRVGDGDDRVGLRRDQPRDHLVPLLLRPHGQPLRVAVRVRDERVAQVGDPAHLRLPLARGADEVHRPGRRGRDHDVDPLVAADAQRGRDRGQVEGHVLVGEEQPPPEQLELPLVALEPRRAVQLLGRLAAARADELHAVHPRERRRRQVVVAVHPLRVVGREHVQLDPEPGQMRRELERPLHAAAARGREVQRDEEHLHGDRS